MSTSVSSSKSGVVQSLSSNPGAEEGTISRTDYDAFIIGSGGSLGLKSGAIAPGSFAGSPRKSTVTFATPYPDTQFSILVTGVDSRSFTFENKTVNGFDINTNAAAALTGEVLWLTSPLGE